MNPIFRYTTMMIILILTNTRVLVLPAEAMGMPHVDPIVKLAQEDAGRDAGLKWFVRLRHRVLDVRCHPCKRK